MNTSWQDTHRPSRPAPAPLRVPGVIQGQAGRRYGRGLAVLGDGPFRMLVEQAGVQVGQKFLEDYLDLLPVRSAESLPCTSP